MHCGWFTCCFLCAMVHLCATRAFHFIIYWCCARVAFRSALRVVHFCVRQCERSKRNKKEKHATHILSVRFVELVIIDGFICSV